MLRSVVLALVFAVGLVNASPAAITVGATVKQTFTADSAKLTATIQAKSYVSASQSATAAQTAVTDLQATLKGLGLDVNVVQAGAATASHREEVVTVGVNADPVNPAASTSNTQTAYVTDLPIAITITDMTKAGKVQSAVAALPLAAGSFKFSPMLADPDKALSQVMTEAMHQAKVKATTLASSPDAPSTLGGVVSVNETNPGTWSGLELTYSITVSFASTAK